MDPRHEQRLKIVQNLFATTFKDLKDNLPYPEITQTAEIVQKLTDIDAIIAKHAPKYPLDRIAKTDLAVLRLAIFELTVHPTEPVKVVINEAVDLAKELGGDRSYAFVNAVLGSIVSEVKQNIHESTIE